MFKFLKKPPHLFTTVGVVVLFLVLFAAGWGGAVYLNMKNAEASALAYGKSELQLTQVKTACTTQVNADGYIGCAVTGQNQKQDLKAYNVACPSMWNFHFGCRLQGNIVN